MRSPRVFATTFNERVFKFFYTEGTLALAPKWRLGAGHEGEGRCYKQLRVHGLVVSQLPLTVIRPHSHQKHRCSTPSFLPAVFVTPSSVHESPCAGAAPNEKRRCRLSASSVSFVALRKKRGRAPVLLQGGRVASFSATVLASDQRVVAVALGARGQGGP